MTSREIVSRAVHFRKPPRLPAVFGALGVCDTAEVPIATPAGDSQWAFMQEAGADEWGCVWKKTETKNMGQVKGHPLENIEDLPRMKAPDYNDDRRYVTVPEALDRYEREGKYVMASIFMVLFERMHSLHGFENVLTGLLDDRPAMEALADRIVDTHVTFVDNIGRRFGDRVQGFTMTDDWGTQAAAFVSFDLWMDFFLPRYRRIFDRMHSYGYDVWVHSCGKINEIIEGFIRAGVNVVNLQQPRALGIEEIGRRYRGRITFESLSDIQATLPKNDRPGVDADAEELARHWMSPEGGFVFSDYGDDDGIGIRDSGVKRYMYDRFSEISARVYGEPLPVPPGP